MDEVVRGWLPASGIVGFLPSSPDPDRFWFEPRRAYYGEHGLELRYFGLEDEFDEARLPELFGCDAIHLSGGNTFQFNHWLRERGLADRLRKYVADGGVLIGVSAGAILMTPEVSSSLLCGDVPYRGQSGGPGLGLVDFAVVPHIGAPNPEVERFARGFGGPVYLLPDDGSILVEDDQVTHRATLAINAARSL